MEVLKVTENAVNLWTDTMETQVILVTKTFFAKIIETWGTDHNKLFVTRAFIRVTSEIVTNMLVDEGVCEAFESAIIWASTSGGMV